MKITIQEYRKEEDIVEFSIEGVDYECQYTLEQILQSYPVSHNSITNTVDCETVVFDYMFPVMESLKRTDNVFIGDREGICTYLELQMNS